MPQRKRAKVSVLAFALPLKALLYRLSLFILICASVVLIVAGRTKPEAIETARAMVMDIVVPVLGVLSSPLDSMAVMRDSMSNMVYVYDENQKLRVQNAKLLRTQNLATQLATENARLRELVHFIPEPGVAYISARVVSESGGPFSHSAMINAGSGHNITKGQVVISRHGLVGRVNEVGGNSSRILLLTDINSKIPVMTSDSNERAILSGNTENYPSLLYLPRESKVQVGESVVTSGDGKFFPAGIPVGKVTSIRGGKVQIQPFAEIGRLEYISVVDYRLKK